MARKVGKVVVDYTEGIKKWKAAKTGEEMIEAWEAHQPPGVNLLAFNKDIFGWYVENAPQILKFFTNDPLIYSFEHGALDPKTRELVMIAICAAMQCGPGLTVHIPIALGQGATEEEIIDVIHSACYEFAKIGAASLGQGIKEGFRLASEAKLV